MKNLNILFKFSIICIFLSCNSEKVKLPSKTVISDPPNIIFILADDIGYGDLKCYGHPYALTPNIDKLAMDGLKLGRFYVSGNTCSPSRTAFMTGKHPATFKNDPASVGFGDQITITQLLNENGYIIGHFGKWHIGQAVRKTSHAYGIDEVKISNKSQISMNDKDKSVFNDAINFIEENKDSPFYINIWAHTSHFPVPEASKNLKEIFKNTAVNKSDFKNWFIKNKLEILQKNNVDLDTAMVNYLAEIYSFDSHVGRVMKKLEDLGLMENTIVVFSSDQGPEEIDSIAIKSAMYNMLGYTGGLRGGKHTQYEGGVRVPFIIKWPKKITGNQFDETSVVSALDWLPSICSLLGIDISEYEFDGEDKSEVWIGHKSSQNKMLFWKTIDKNSQISVLKDNWKMHRESNNSTTLYNLEVDPFEELDLSKTKPEIVKILNDSIDSWLKTLPN